MMKSGGMEDEAVFRKGECGGTEGNSRGPEHSLMDFFECMFGLAIGAVDVNDPRLHMLSEEEAG